MKKILLTICFAVISLSMFAVKATTAAITIIQSDGTPITVYLHGDEDFSWYTDAAGNLLERHGNDFKKIAMSKEAFFAKARHSRQKNMARRISIGSRTPSYFPHVGSPKALVILVQFPDSSKTDSTSHFSVADPKKTFNDYLNGRGALVDYGLNEDRNYGSAYQYFHDMSGGQFTPQFDVVGPYTMPHKAAYYGKDENGRHDVNIRQLTADACNAADADVDFSKYDNNGDGVVDLVYIIYAGYSQSNGAPDDAIWPQAFLYNNGSYDGMKIGFSGVNNELNYYPGRPFKSEPYKRVNGIGLFCHEFSHTLGLPDLYSGLNVDNQEMEYWDLMDYGEYTDNGYTPTPYTPWEKEVMGWTRIKSLADDSVQVTLHPDSALKINSTTSQYVILHNIQNTGWASELIGHGMLVYKIDYPYSNVNMGDMPNARRGKPAITVLPADSLLISSYNVDNGKYTQKQYAESLYGDPFPGSQNVDSLLQFTLNDGVVINKPLYKITEEASGDITFYYLKKPASRPTDGINGVKVIPQVTDNRIFTIDGRFVGTDTSVLPKGIYIINHKKIVVGK